ASRDPWASAIGSRSARAVRRPAAWREAVSEAQAAAEPALRDPLRLVEVPVDAEIDPALAVLLLGLRQRDEAARDQRADVPVVVERDAVPLVGDERERDGVGAVEAAEGLEECSAEPGMAGGVGGERRGEIRPGQVVSGRAQRREGRIAHGSRVAVTGARR